MARVGVVSLKKQAARILAGLEKEIAKKEKEIAALREEADICVSILGKGPPKASTKSESKRESNSESRKRIDWAEVLGSLPERFNAKDVIAKINKPPAAVYTQLYQMTKTGRLNRTKDGYEKV